MRPLVDEVEILGTNPHYAHICYPDSQPTTVSTKRLAPCGECNHCSLPLVLILPGPSLEEELKTQSVFTEDSTEDFTETGEVPIPTSTPDLQMPL